MADRTTKALLLAIAIGLWFNLAAQWAKPLQAQSPLDSYLAEIRDKVNQLANGSCSNRKLC